MGNLARAGRWGGRHDRTVAGRGLPMVALGVSDPRAWSATDWLSDAVPRLAYGAVTVAVLHSQD